MFDVYLRCVDGISSFCSLPLLCEDGILVLYSHPSQELWVLRDKLGQNPASETWLLPLQGLLGP